MRLLFLQLPLRRLWVVALTGIMFLAVAGITQVWSQSSELSLNNSSQDLNTWNELSMKFNQTLEEQSMRLSLALTETQTSRTNLQLLTNLLEASSRANEDLKTYNLQIAERMQERDEDLFFAYKDIDRLEKENLKKDKTILILGFILAGIVLLIGVFIFVRIKTGGVRRFFK